MFIYGGFSKSSKCFGDSYKFDITSKVWKRIQTNSGPKKRAFFTLTHVGDGIALFGGIDEDDKIYGDMWVLRESIWYKINENG